MHRALRLVELITLPLVWFTLVRGALSIHRFVFVDNHSLCGPWGCGPSSGALLAVHLAWFVAEPQFLPNESQLNFGEDLDKDDFLSRVNRVVAEKQLHIKEGTEVARVRKLAERRFEVETNSGKSFPTRQVLVAIGRQGQPKLLDWYGSDWDQVGGYLPWLAERAKDGELKQAIKRAARGEIRVAFFDYDWSLNSQAPGGASVPKGAGKKAEFGSGSIPNE